MWSNRARFRRPTDPTETPVTEKEEGVTYYPYYTGEQEQTVRLSLHFGFTDEMTTHEKRNKFVEIIWSLLAPLHGIFELLLTNQPLVIYDRIKINGLPGYENVLRYLFDALALSKFEDTAGNPYLKTIVYDTAAGQPVTRSFDNEGNVVYDSAFDVNDSFDEVFEKDGTLSVQRRGRRTD